MKLECVEKCVRIALGFHVCKGDKIMVKVGREIFIGTITEVSPIALMLDDSILIKHSKITWIRWMERGCK